MNCQEVQSLVEEAIDNRLLEPCKSKVAQHLARCASCKALFAAEKSEHAALFRALNDVSDIPPPATSPAALAARLAAIPAAKRAGSIVVPLWLKRAAAIALLCGGAAFAAWIGTTMESCHLGGDNSSSVTTPEGEPEMKPKQLMGVMSATIALAVPPAQGSSSAEATFDSFSSEFRTMEDSATLPSFSSTEPQGFIIVIR